MYTRILIQFALLIFFLTTIFFFYHKYFSFKKDQILQTDINQNFKGLDSENNLLKDIEYLYADKNGNRYTINSEYGEISNKNVDIILMKNVKAEIEFFEKDVVYIESDSAKYNSQNFDTNFSQNVNLRYINHEIIAENVDLSFQKNFAWVYNKVFYKNSYNELFADKIEIDLLTKNSKIFMDNNKKIKIIGK